MKRFKWIGILGLALILIGCSRGNSELAAELGEAQALWEMQGPVSYEMEVLYFNSLEGSQLRTVRVENRAVVDIKYDCAPLPGSTRGCGIQGFRSEGMQMDELFEFLEAAPGRLTIVNTDDEVGYVAYVGFTNDDRMRIDLEPLE